MIGLQTKLFVCISVLGIGFSAAASVDSDAIDRFITAHSRAVAYQVSGSFAVRRTTFDALDSRMGAIMERVGQASPGLPLPDGFGVYMDLEFLVDGSSFRKLSIHRTMGGPRDARTDILVWTEPQKWLGRIGGVSPLEANVIEPSSHQEELDQFRSGITPWALSRATSSSEYGQIVRFLLHILEEGAVVETIDFDANSDRVLIPEWNAEFVIDRRTGELLEAMLPSPGSSTRARFQFMGRHEGEVFPARYPKRMWTGKEGGSADLTQGDAVRVYAKPELISAPAPDAFEWESLRDSAYYPAMKRVLRADGSVNEDLTGKAQSVDVIRKTNPDRDPMAPFKPRRGASTTRKALLGGAVVCLLIGVVWIVRRRTA